MTDISAPTTHRPPRRSLLAMIPVVGLIVRDIEREPDSIWYLIVAVLSLVIVATATWGLAVLAMTALAMVPVMFTILVVITRG